MDLNIALKNINKITEYVSDISTSNLKLYSKSRDKLEAIYNSCLSCTKIISDILDVDLNNSENISQSTIVDLNQEIQHLKSEIVKLKSNEISNTYDDIENISISKYDKCRKLNSEELSLIVRNYKFALNQTAMNNSKFEYVNKASDMIWRWFDFRILKSHPNSPKFHYDVYRFNNIIYSFIIAIGFHIESNTFEEFEDNFNSWCIQLDQSSESNKWIAPFEIYSIERGNYKNYINLTSVILWDILLDLGFNLLCKQDTNIYFKESMIWDLTSDMNIDLLDNYFQYKDDIESTELLLGGTL